MRLSRTARRLTLLVHVTSSVGWLGAAFAFLPLAGVAAVSTDERSVGAALRAMPWVLRFVIVPGSFAAIASGTMLAIGTPWGLLRHYWVVVKAVLSFLCVVVLLVQVAPIEALSQDAFLADLTLVARPDRARPLIHAVGGIAVLLVVQALGVLKPRGLTPYGWRRSR